MSEYEISKTFIGKVAYLGTVNLEKKAKRDFYICE